MIDNCIRWIGEKVSFVYFISMGIIGFEVTSRYLFNSPTIWVHESVITLSAIGFLIGGAYTLQRREHIRISIVYQILPEPVQRTLDILVNLIMLAYLGFLGYASFIIAWKSWQMGETSASAWNQPTPIIIKSTLVIGVVLMFIQGVAALIRHIQEWNTPASTD